SRMQLNRFALSLELRGELRNLRPLPDTRRVDTDCVSYLQARSAGEHHRDGFVVSLVQFHSSGSPLHRNPFDPRHRNVKANGLKNDEESEETGDSDDDLRKGLRHRNQSSDQVCDEADDGEKYDECNQAHLAPPTSRALYPLYEPVRGKSTVLWDVE